MIALFVTAALSGCASAPEDEGDGDDTDTGFDPGPGTGPGDGNETTGGEELAVTWLEVPDGNDSAALTFRWSVEVASGDDNMTGNDTLGNDTGGNETGNETVLGGDPVEIEETGLAYGFTAVPSPSNPTDYDNVTGQSNNTTAPDEFEAMLEATGDGTLYVRAYALSGGLYYWSTEVTVNATAGGGVEHEIVIQDGTVPVGQFSGFNTDELTIAVGDSVVWNNTASNSHSVTITGPEEFETGSIAAGSASDPIVFMVAGDYEFELSGSSESGTITVEE